MWLIRASDDAPHASTPRSISCISMLIVNTLEKHSTSTHTRLTYSHG